MKAIRIIALNTYREIIRDRILYGIFVFAILLIGLSLALGQLSFAEQMRITTSFGLAAIQLSAAILSIFLGSSLVTKEIEKKTIMTLLVRPVTRLQFLMGKAAGLLLLQLTVMTALGAVLLAVFFGLGIPIQHHLFIALHGILLEAIVLLALALFFSSFTTPALVVSFSLGLFLIGHWLDSLVHFAKKGSGLISLIGTVIPFVLPDLESFNWRAAVVYGDEVGLDRIGLSTLHSMAWFIFLVGMAALIFRRKDFA